MNYKSPFNVLLNKPFFTLKEDSDVLHWMNAHYDQHLHGNSARERIDKQTNSLAIFQNKVPVSGTLVSQLDGSGTPYVGIRRYNPIIVNHLADIVHNWVARLGIRKPTYNVFPRLSKDLSDKAKAKSAKLVLQAKAQEQNHEFIRNVALYHMFVFGEAYIECRWNANIGPLDEEYMKLKEEEEHCEDGPKKKKKRPEYLRLGDVETVLHDPRNIIVASANTFDKADWVIILDCIQTDKVKFMYGLDSLDLDNINDVWFFSDFGLNMDLKEDHMVVYRMYHRATPEVPEGAYIVATRNQILEKGPLPCKAFIRRNRFPVLQLTDQDIWGSARGYAGTVMENLKSTQIAINNLYLTAIINQATFTPKLLIQDGAHDKQGFRTGDRTVIPYNRGFEKPDFLVKEVISQGHLLLIDKLTAKMMQVSNVLPISRGDTIANTESRQMLDFFKDQETQQSQPKDEKFKRFLEDWARIQLDIVSEYYEENEARQFQYFGKLQRRNTAELSVADLSVDVDISIETGNSFTGSFQGRIRQIQDILSIAPNVLNKAEIVDILEIGSPDKMYDTATETVDLVDKELEIILGGGRPKSPEKFLDLATYYDCYMKALQRADIREILPDEYIPNGGGIGNTLLDQIGATEMIIDSVLEEEKARLASEGIMPDQPGIPTLSQLIYSRYPAFPTIFVKENIETLDPHELGTPPEPSLDQQGLPPPQGMPSELPPQMPMNNNMY